MLSLSNKIKPVVYGLIRQNFYAFMFLRKNIQPLTYIEKRFLLKFLFTSLNSDVELHKRVKQNTIFAKFDLKFVQNRDNLLQNLKNYVKSKKPEL